MENIYIYADFDFLEQPEEIGVLTYERVGVTIILHLNSRVNGCPAMAI